MCACVSMCLSVHEGEEEVPEWEGRVARIRGRKTDLQRRGGQAGCGERDR